MLMTVMGWPDNGERGAEYWENMASQMRAIAHEDQHLFAGMQEALDSGFLPGVLMGYQERALYWYQEEIDRRSGAENIPEELRIKPVPRSAERSVGKECGSSCRSRRWPYLSIKKHTLNNHKKK